jgi:hypothetical protein
MHLNILKWNADDTFLYLSNFEEVKDCLVHSVNLED